MLAATARAQQEPKRQFGSPGIVLSVDRLLPLLSYESVKTTANDGSSVTDARTSIAFTNGGPYGVFSSFYNLPRLAIDWLPVRNLTLGLATWLYADLSATTSTSPAGGGSSKSVDQPKVTYWGVAPRVGYTFPLGDKLAIWPRAGIEYYDVTTSNVGNGSGSVTQLAVDLEAMLVIFPWNHIGFTVGPTIDIPITGEQTTTNTTTMGTTTTTMTQRVDSAMFQVGLSASMLAHF
ncbi:MAG: hypothetical protein ABSE49_27065 [Polyangiaceae bacterium]